MDMLNDAGFDVEAVEPYEKHRPLAALTGQADPDDVRRIGNLLNGLNEPQKRSLRLEEKEGQLFINHWYVMLAAEKTKPLSDP